jgi:TolB-like protein
LGGLAATGAGISRQSASYFTMMAPSRDEISLQLERLLSSEPFANAERASRFLRYVVERTLAGEGDRLKEFVVGVDVFDRGDQYDPRIDSIVRVEAGRLRTKLDHYYGRVAGDDRVVIRIPRGSYVPEFDYRTPEPDPIAPIPTDTGRRAWPIRRAAIGGIALLVVVGAWASSFPPDLDSRVPGSDIRATSPVAPDSRPDGRGQNPEVPDPSPDVRGPSPVRDPSPAGRGTDPDVRVVRSQPRTQRSESRASEGRAVGSVPSVPRVSVIVLPFEHYSTDRETQLLAARFTDGLTSELARIEHVAVVSRTSAVRLDTEGRTLRDIARAVDAQVVVEGSLLVEGTRVDADVRLVDTVVDRKSWSRQFTADVSELGALQRRVAADVAAFIKPR